jgi:hypothetical protein
MPIVRVYTTTDGHVFTDETVACLIGASLPTPAACQEAITLLREALAAGVSQETLWRLSGIAVWDGLLAARAARSTALGGAPGPFTPTNDRIVFADLDDEDGASSAAPKDAQLPMFDR